MKKSFIPLLITLVLSTTISFLHGQQLAVKNYTTEDGLVQSSVYALLQDKDGYLWLGTEGGISKFDGGRFFNYSTNDGLPVNFISSIYQDRKGTLWFGGNNGIILNYNKNRFTTFSAKKHLKSIINCIYEDKTGNLWFCTDGDGVAKLVQNDLVIYNQTNGLRSNVVRSICQDNYGNIWFSYADKGIGVTCFNGNSFQHFSRKNGLAGDSVGTILNDGKNIWFGTTSGISRYDGKHFTTYSIKDGIPKDIFTCSYKDPHNTLWFGTLTNGLIKYQNGHFVRYSVNNGLRSNYILSILTDKRGDLWLGTNNRGVCRIPAEWFTLFTKKEGLLNDEIYAINQDKSDDLWFGTYGRGIAKYSNGKFTHYTSKEGLSDNFISSILIDNQGLMWIGTLKGGINKFNGKKFSSFTTKNGLISNLIYCIKQDRNNTIWIGTNKGVSKYSDNKFSSFGTQGDGLKGCNVYSICVDRQNNIWFGTDVNGVFKFDGNKLINYNVKNGLANKCVNSICQDWRGNMWFATDYGISRFSNGKFYNYCAKDGLSNNTCVSMTEHEGYLFVGTFGGLNRIDLDKLLDHNALDIKVYKAKEGLKFSEAQMGAVFKDRENNLWFGTIEGVVKFTFNKNTTLFHPPIYITSVKLFDKDTKSSQIKEVEIFSSGNHEPVELSYKQNLLKFDYGTIDFGSDERIYYRYQLIGINNSEIETNQRTVTYPYLPPGKYTFVVRVKGSDGLWSQNQARFDFIITPPFYDTLWFRISVLGVILLSIYMIYRYKTEQVQKRNIELALMVRERTKELEDEKNKSDELLHNILPGSTVAELKAKGYVQPREIKNISILFTDFKGFTYIAGMLPAEMLVDELNDIFKGFDEIIERYGVEKLKTIGDSYMVGAGLPEVIEDHAVRLIKVGMEMQNYICERNKRSAIKWEMRAGVHSGSVIAGVVGKKKFSYDIWGDTVNIASRMESAGAPGQINISAYTYMLVKDCFDCEYRGKVTAKGKGELDMYFVKGVK
ncbi:MAG: two-component regulator propeller domain-containing protein [Bacteroidota bacterium]|nr:two-component regulator propeller domain-containing protein [Bacteroidota bacterium]MDP4194399.1 two-component regulator propeller domain-containing protein [Bacteroidota bacterium]